MGPFSRELRGDLMLLWEKRTKSALGCWDRPESEEGHPRPPGGNGKQTWGAGWQAPERKPTPRSEGTASGGTNLSRGEILVLGHGSRVSPLRTA